METRGLEKREETEKEREGKGNWGREDRGGKQLM